jgi:hypothetical protein
LKEFPLTAVLGIFGDHVLHDAISIYPAKEPQSIQGVQDKASFCDVENSRGITEVLR